MNFSDFYSKLFKNLYDCNLYKVQKYGDFSKSEFYGIFASRVLAVAITKTYVYRISSKYVYFYYFAPPYWIRCFQFLGYEL